MNLTGNELDNVIVGTQGANVIYGGSGGADVLVGLGGNDTYIVDGNDIVFEDADVGSDTIYTVSSYTLGAGSHVETLSAFSTGWTSAMNLTGNEFDNVLVGTQGANILDGKDGNDYLAGFSGADMFRFSTALNATTNVDKIEAFETGVDTIALDHAIFAALSSGALPASAFVIGSAAADADDRIIFNSATGALLYDDDGNGAHAAVQFATLIGTSVIAASDFTVI
jgi:serralysin